MDSVEQLELCKLENDRNRLCAELNAVRASIRPLKTKLLVSGLDGFDIDEADDSVYGKKGKFVVKARNQYENVSKDFLVNQHIAWYKTLYPEVSDSEVQRFAYAVVEFIWRNRDKTTIRYVDRVFDVPQKKRKRTGPDGAPRIRKPYIKRPDNVPVTTAEFLDSTIGQKMFGHEDD